MRKFSCILCLFILPDLYAANQKHSPIAKISMEINGESYLLPIDELPTIIRGDTIRIHYVEIGKARSHRLDIQGFEIPVVEGQLPHEENISIETKNQISLKQIQSGFISVISYRNEQEFYRFALPIISPEWKYSELKINQENAVARPGDKLKMSHADQVQLVRIETNLEQNDRINVKFEKRSRQKGVLTSQLVFYYREYAFGSVPIQITNE